MANLSVRFWYLAVAVVIGGNGALAYAVWRAVEEPIAVVLAPPPEPDPIAPPPAPIPSGPTSTTTIVRPIVTIQIPPTRTTPSAVPKVVVAPNPPVPMPAARLAGDVLILVLDTKALRSGEVRESWREQLREAPGDPLLRGRLLGGQVWQLAKPDREPRAWIGAMAPDLVEPFANEDVEGAFRRAREAVRHLRGRAASPTVDVFLLWSSDKNPDTCVKDPVGHRAPPFDEKCRLLWHGTEWNKDTNRGEELYAIFPRSGVIRLGTKPAGLAEAMRSELR